MSRHNPFDMSVDVSTIPVKNRPAFEAVVALIEQFCQRKLTAEYAALGRKMAAVLARKHPSPLTSGKPASWAAGILRVLGRTNFLSDPSQKPHMLLSEIDKGIGVSEATSAAKASTIRKLIDVGPLHPEWTLPSRVDDNPMVWLLRVNGLMVDIRDMPREAQEVAFRQGLIPYIPADRGGGSPPALAPHAVETPMPDPDPNVVYQFKITLKDSKPPIWRRIQVPDATLADLHSAIQSAMGWHDAHLHMFKIDGDCFSTNDTDVGADEYDSADVLMSEVIDGRRKLKFEYEYDFGDDWRHEVLLEKVLPRDPNQQYPLCLAGARACPPEDCGGVWGYAELLAALADPKHPDHDELSDWVPPGFDPEAFDAAEITGVMRQYWDAASEVDDDEEEPK